MARNGQHGEMLGIPQTPLKHEIVVSCELLEGTQGSAAKGAAEHLRLLVQPHNPLQTGDRRAQ